MTLLAPPRTRSALPETPHSSRPVLAGLTATVVTAALLWFGSGLHAVPVLTWFAALPVLLVAPLLRARWAFLAAVVGWLGGLANLWTYTTKWVEAPIPIVVGLLLLIAVLFGFVVLTFRACLLRRGAATAVLAAASMAVMADYVLSRLSPHGTFTSFAYTQADTPVLPMVAITGGWGITALLFGAPAAVAAVVWRTRLRLGRAPLVTVAVVVLALVALPLAGFAAAGQGRSVRVATVSTPDPQDEPARLGTAGGDHVLATDLTGIADAASRGARIAVLAEAGLRMPNTSVAGLAEQVAQAAGPRLAVVIGIAVDGPGKVLHNEAILVQAGQQPMVYRKQHLVPGSETGVTPGHTTVVANVDGLKVGLLICKDIDFPWTVRKTVSAGAQLLAVPVWDFHVDGWLHSRMALVSSTENGVAMVRSARAGRDTISNVHGSVLAEGNTEARPIQVVVGNVRVASHRTPYAVLGDWLPGVAVLALLGCLLALRRVRKD